MSFPRVYTRGFFQSGAEVGTLPYEEQKAALFADGFSFSNSWERALRSVESFELFDVPYDVPELDSAYASEFGASGWSGMEVAVDIIRRLRPQVVFLSSLESWTPAQIDQIRAASPEVAAIVGMAGVDISHLPSLRKVDVLLTCMKGFASKLRAEGMDARVVAHAFDPKVLDRVRFPQQRSGFTFLGNIVSGPHYHDERARLIEILSERCGLVVYSKQDHDGARGLPRYLKQLAAYRVGKLINLAPESLGRLPYAAALRQAAAWPAPPRFRGANPAREQWRSPVYGMEMYQTLACAQLTVNVHIGGAGDYAANMRLFEATGVGTCLLTDSKSDLAEFFEPGVEVVSFSSVEEAVEKATALMGDPKAAMDIGLRGQARTLREHTYECRAPLVAAALRDAVNRAPRERGRP